MTLEEAQKRKSIIGSTIEQDGLIYNIVIGPARSKDLQVIMQTYKGEDLTDDYFISFAVNEKYKIYAVRCKNSEELDVIIY